MKKEESSLKRKEQMAASLKTLMEQKDFQQITIQDITDDCGISRCTFYYHFKDIYDLLCWAFQNEVLVLIQKSENCLTWDEGLRLFLNHTADNRRAFRRILDSLSQNTLRNLFYQEISHIMDLFLLDTKGVRQISETYWNFLRDFYIDALCGVIIRWIRQDTLLPLDTMIAYLRPLMDGHSIDEAFRQAEEDKL